MISGSINLLKIEVAVNNIKATYLEYENGTKSIEVHGEKNFGTPLAVLRLEHLDDVIESLKLLRAKIMERPDA